MAGLVGSLLTGEDYGNLSTEEIDSVHYTIAPFIWTILLGLLCFVFILLSIKRFRDTGKPFWKILIPIINIKILFFEESKKRRVG